MSEDQFTKLFNYMTKRFDEIDKRFDETASQKRLEELIGTVDGIAKDVEDIKLEMTVSKRQYDRHEDWIQRASRELKIDYDTVA